MEAASHGDQPSRLAIRKALAPYAPQVTRIGVEHFLMDYAVYFAALAGVLFLEPIWLKVLCSIVAGIKISNLATLGHDGGHGSLTSSARLNDLLGMLGFLPGLTNYRLWIYNHHYLHHLSTNGGHRDAWTPYSREEFDALPPFRRLRERFYRSSWGLGLAPYYMFERQFPEKLFPRAHMPVKFRASAWRHFGVVIGYVAIMVGGLAAAPLYSNTGSVTAILLGFVLPFYVWMTFFSFTSFVQHTHPRIAHFREWVDHKQIPPERVSLHLKFPRWFDALSHNVYNHPAHHVNMRIPFHALAKAQWRLNQLVGPAAVIQKFSFRWLHETLRNCRLYDYEAQRWLDFNGRPTSTSIAMNAPAKDQAKGLAPQL
jgi:omega-6 fatty acid desaturase (delta-12 desaturase)